MDRPLKRRWEILVERYALNPLIRAMFCALESQPATVRIALAPTSA
jgi:hypothetical protein